MINPVIIGNATLYNGDCVEILPQIGAFDCLVTDPPYKMEIRGRGFASTTDYFSRLDYGTNTKFELSDAYYNLVLERINEKNMVFFCNKMMKLDIENWAVKSGMTFDELVLLKTTPAPLSNNQWLPDKEFAVHVFRSLPVRGNFKTKQTWWQTTNFKQDEFDHPSVKPQHIVERILLNVTDEGQTVLDTFMGSGTTGAACLKTCRKFIGIERDARYFDIACKRIEDAQRQLDMFIK